MIRALIVVSIALLFGGWALIDLLIHAGSSLICRAFRDVSNAWYARKWGLPRDAFDEATQRRIAGALRSDMVCRFGVTEAEWAEFVEAHSEKTEEAS